MKSTNIAYITHTESNTTTVVYYRGKQVFTYTDCESVVIEKSPWRDNPLTVSIHSCVFLSVTREQTHFDPDKIVFGEGVQLDFYEARTVKSAHTDPARVIDAVDEFYQQWKRPSGRIDFVRLLVNRKIEAPDFVAA